MAIFYTDTHASDSLEGDFDNLLDYQDECKKIAEECFEEYASDTVKIVVFDFHRNKSVIFAFERETKITCTAY